MKNKDTTLSILALCIATICIGMLFLATGFTIIMKEQDKRIATLENQVTELQEENQFLKEHYEEEIVMLDSQLLVLEGELVEMKDGVELIKK